MFERAPIWNVGGRRLCELRCSMPKPSGIINTCTIEVILPDKDIQFYCFYFPYKKKLFKIYGDASGSATILSHLPDLWKEKSIHILSVNKLYPIDLDQPLNTQVDALFHKLKLLTTFS